MRVAVRLAVVLAVAVGLVVAPSAQAGGLAPGAPGAKAVWTAADKALRRVTMPSAPWTVSSSLSAVRPSGGGP